MSKTTKNDQFTKKLWLLAGLLVLSGGLWYGVNSLMKQGTVAYIGGRRLAGRQKPAESNNPACSKYGKRTGSVLVPNQSWTLNRSIKQYMNVVRADDNYIYLLGGSVSGNTDKIRVYDKSNMSLVKSMTVDISNAYYLNDMIVDGDNLYVSKSDEEGGQYSSVEVYSVSSGSLVDEIGRSVLIYPQGMAKDRSGRLVVVDDLLSGTRDTIYIFTPTGAVVSATSVKDYSKERIAVNKRTNELYLLNKDKKSFDIYSLSGTTPRKVRTLRLPYMSGVVQFQGLQKNGNIVMTTFDAEQQSRRLRMYEINPTTGRVVYNGVMSVVSGTERGVSSFRPNLAAIDPDGNLYMSNDLYKSNWQFVKTKMNYLSCTQQSVKPPFPTPTTPPESTTSGNLRLVKSSLPKGTIGSMYSATMLLEETSPDTVDSVSWTVSGLPKGLKANNCFAYPTNDPNSNQKFGCRISGVYRGTPRSFTIQMVFVGDDGSVLKHTGKLIFDNSGRREKFNFGYNPTR